MRAAAGRGPDEEGRDQSNRGQATAQHRRPGRAEERAAGISRRGRPRPQRRQVGRPGCEPGRPWRPACCRREPELSGRGERRRQGAGRAGTCKAWRGRQWRGGQQAGACGGRSAGAAGACQVRACRRASTPLPCGGARADRARSACRAFRLAPGPPTAQPPTPPAAPPGQKRSYVELLKQSSQPAPAPPPPPAPLPAAPPRPVALQHNDSLGKDAELVRRRPPALHLWTHAHCHVCRLSAPRRKPPAQQEPTRLGMVASARLSARACMRLL